MRRLSIIILIFFLVGCGKIVKNKENKIKDIFKENATDYYEKYSVKGFNEVIVSINSLREANEKAGANYDLTTLNKCKDSSYVKLIINTKDQKVDSIEYFLNCE